MAAAALEWFLKNWTWALPVLLVLILCGALKLERMDNASLRQDKDTLTARVSDQAAAITQLKSDADKAVAASLAAQLDEQELEADKNLNEELIHAEKIPAGDCPVTPAVIRNNIDRLYKGRTARAKSDRAKAAAGSHLLRGSASGAHNP